MEELVSIIMPSYNSSKFIAASIESVIAQTYKNWELLITDDCSKDNTVEIVRQYVDKDERIKLFCLQENSGAGVARNNSIKQAKGRFIAFLDSDDRWKPNKLEVQIPFMLENGYELSYSSYMTCNEKGETNGIVVCRKKETFSSIKRDDKIGFLTLIYDVKMLGKVYMPIIRKRQDYGLKILLLRKTTVAYGLKEPLAIYRKGHGLSSNKVSLCKYNIHCYMSVLGWSYCKSFLWFVFVFMPTFLQKKYLQHLYND